MNKCFFSAMSNRLSQLAADLRYLHKPTGAMIAPQVIDVMLDRPTTPQQEGEEFPYIRWMVGDGEFNRSSPTRFVIAIDGGIYTDGSVVDGTSQITELCTALGKIVEDPGFPPYKLAGKVTFSFGQRQSGDKIGVQPHPYYFCQLVLEFAGY